MAKVQKTILGKKVIRVYLSKVMYWNINKKLIQGHITLDGGVQIKISKGKYHIVVDGIKKGVILKTSPNYPKVKRIIAKAFKTYRRGSKGGQMHHAEYWKSRVIDGLHNINLFKTSSISFTENKSNFLKLAS